MPMRIRLNSRPGLVIRISRKRWILRLHRLIQNAKLPSKRKHVDENLGRVVRTLLPASSHEADAINVEELVCTESERLTPVTQTWTKYGAAARAAARKAARLAAESGNVGKTPPDPADQSHRMIPPAGTADAPVDVTAGDQEPSDLPRTVPVTESRREKVQATGVHSSRAVASKESVAKLDAAARFKGKGKSSGNDSFRPTPLGARTWKDVTLDEGDHKLGFDVRCSGTNTCPTLCSVDPGGKVAGVAQTGHRLLRIEGVDASMLTEGQVLEMLGSRPLHLRFGP